jgi:heme a synthase
MDLPERRTRVLRRLAWLCAVLVLAITSLSAFIRLSKAQAGCEPWPQCYEQSAQPAPILVARTLHRTIAVVALVVILVMLMASFTRPVLRTEARLACALLALALFLAVLGRWTAGAHSPAITLGNLLAGFAMFTVSVQLALHVTPMRPAVPRNMPFMPAWAGVAAALALIETALGGLVPGLPRDGADALLPPMHWAGAAALLLVALPLAVAAWRQGRREGAAVLALLTVEVALGLCIATPSLQLAAAVAHNIAGNLLLATLVGLALQKSATSEIRA